MGRAASSTIEISDKDKIKNRFMEIFDTVDDFKTFFNSILPKNSLLNSIIKIDDKNEKEQLCKVVMSYLGNNFFVYVGKVRPDSDEEKLSKTDEKNFRSFVDNKNNLIEKPELYNEIKEFLVSYDKKKNHKIKKPEYIVREKIIEQYLIYQKNDTGKSQAIIDSFNHKVGDKDKVETIEELSQSSKFLTAGKSGAWVKDLCTKDLKFPLVVVDKQQKEPPLPETTSLRTKKPLSRLYPFQTEGLIKIHNILNNDIDVDDCQQKRILLNLPTGAGKTRMTVQALIEWLNLRALGKCENAHPQQQNPRGLIFWLASTVELCEQASESFRQIFEQIGIADEVYLTNWFGSNRRDLRVIRNDNPGTHIVVTNTDHTNKKFRDYRNRDAGRFKFDQFAESPELQEISNNTIAIVIDEAHDVSGERYQDFLASMGFDLNKNKRGKEKKIYNTKNIALIGLTATPYKGTGTAIWYQCTSCNQIFKDPRTRDRHISKNYGHDIIEVEPHINDEEFEIDNSCDPKYFSTLNVQTRKIHKTFGGVYLPIPSKSISQARPNGIIDIPLSAHVDDNVKISASNSYDPYSKIKSFSWEILHFEKELLKSHDEQFYYNFKTEGRYDVQLTVVNERGISHIVNQKIEIKPKIESKIGEKSTGSLEDIKEFYDILTHDQKILCPITYGVIDFGKTIKFNSAEEEKKWNLGKSKEEDDEVSNDVKYNEKICDAVHKCINEYGRDRVLLFANSVKHSQELALIFRIKYGYDTDVEEGGKGLSESVDGMTNPGVRRKIISDFREGKIKILSNFGVLTTGFDVPKIDTLFVCRDVGSNALLTQMIGRGQRGETPGGTKDLWLIMSDFPHVSSKGEKLRLGWEALAEGWEKFSDEIKNNLNLSDHEIDIEKTETDSEKDLVDHQFIMNIEPITNLWLSCQTCKNEIRGLKNCLKEFGYKSEKVSEKSFQDAVLKKLKENDFNRNCNLCRTLRDYAAKSGCEFTKLIAKEHKLDPVFIFTINFIHGYQKEKRKVVWKDLADDLKNTPSLKGLDVSPNTSGIKRLISTKLLIIKNNNDLEFLKIKNIDACGAVISKILNNPDVISRIENILKESKPRKKSSATYISDIDIFYSDLKKIFGHIPTERQFKNKLNKKLENQFNEMYNNDYPRFIHQKHEHIAADQNLKDSLYEEYFEKCMKENQPITHEELDKYGEYHLDDYRQIWTTIEKFENSVYVKPVLKEVLENHKKYKKNRDSEWEEISKDILNLKKKQPANYYHYETIKTHSQLHVSRYICQMKISHLRFLKNYHGKDVGKFLQLVSDFFRLQKCIGVVPTKDEFTELTSSLTTGNFMNEFGIKEDDYLRFLKIISVDPPDILGQSERIKKIKKEILEKLKKFEKKNGREKTEIYIDMFNPDVCLSVQIKKYFPIIDELKNLLWE
ncbi:DEAD/DEAH box helicase family protein [Candidatus Nitrosopelagicus sp.]|nr:DEAD/DEAH box helicase family protein [Candidatus Nitrosopelagicus sp.]